MLDNSCAAEPVGNRSANLDLVNLNLKEKLFTLALESVLPTLHVFYFCWTVKAMVSGYKLPYLNSVSLIMGVSAIPEDSTCGLWCPSIMQGNEFASFQLTPLGVGKLVLCIRRVGAIHSQDSTVSPTKDVAGCEHKSSPSESDQGSILQQDGFLGNFESENLLLPLIDFFLGGGNGLFVQPFLLNISQMKKQPKVL